MVYNGVLPDGELCMHERMMQILDELMDATAEQRAILNAEYDVLWEQYLVALNS